MEEMAKSHLFNKAQSPSKDQVTERCAKCELLKSEYNFFFSCVCVRERIYNPYDSHPERIHEGFLIHIRCNQLEKKAI